ncbi:MAG: glutamine-hydrolyzing GMP synthase [Deltaproteobacteria bacterium]|nr:glutamine-hydrolyzing GMP synthase [Deltaproteobacteria bacterium]
MSTSIHDHKILILDFGSQTTQLIARRVRELKVYCEMHPFNMPLDEIRAFAPQGIILSGGPASVYEKGAPITDRAIFEMGAPVLGICYGMQLMTFVLGGEVARAQRREYGHAGMYLDDITDLFRGMDPAVPEVVWMSHGDRIQVMPEGFTAIAHTDNSPVAAMGDKSRKLFGVQFHPEVVHTRSGTQILDNFLFAVCELEPTWNMRSFIEDSTERLKERIGDDRIICALSGGVDSSVVAALLHNAVGDRLTCVFVDNGVLRAGEAERVIEVFKNHLKVDLRFVPAADRFLDLLKGVVDPEEKRKIIGHEFIRVFEETARSIGDVKYLAQGTLYPDVIESVSFKGPSATIKSHHNVGGLPDRMNLELVEPLRELFKDEVRIVGEEMGLPHELVQRHPFPGPGLAIRILGEVTKERLEILRRADRIVQEEMRRSGYYEKVWQAFAVLLPIRTVGVMGDERTYEHVAALRVVDSLDAMTADWTRLPYEVLAAISSRIINEVKGINRVVYDISSKPPSTIEWE